MEDSDMNNINNDQIIDQNHNSPKTGDMQYTENEDNDKQKRESSQQIEQMSDKDSEPIPSSHYTQNTKQSQESSESSQNSHKSLKTPDIDSTIDKSYDKSANSPINSSEMGTDTKSTLTSITPCKRPRGFKSNIKEVNPDLFNKRLKSAMDAYTRLKEIQKTQKHITDTSQADMFFFYRDPEIKVDQYTTEIVISLEKPMALDQKLLKQKKAELKRLEKEIKAKEKEEKKGECEKKQQYFDDFDPIEDGDEPWWHATKRQPLSELLNEYKYPLQKMLSEDQILAMRKMMGNGDKGSNGRNNKERNYTRFENKNKHVPPPRQTSRPRRQAAQNASIQMGLSNMDPDNSFRAKNMHELVECQRFLNETQQPCALFITLEALILMTCHSHIHRNEVIGFVSGHRIKTKTKPNILLIQETVPCQAVEFNDGNNVDYSKNVELHPESAQTRKEEIEAKGLSLLGWYHSHPKFEVNPSHIDVINQEMYQKLHIEEGKLFIGLIISPYFSTSDTGLKQNCMPRLRCFVTILNKDTESIHPYEIAINILPQTRLYKTYLFKEMTELHDNPFSVDKINLKHETCEIRGKKNTKLHLKKGEKLIRSVKQLFDMNIEKIKKQKISATPIAKHFEGLSILKSKVDHHKLQLNPTQDSVIQSVAATECSTVVAAQEVQEVIAHIQEEEKEKEREDSRIDDILADMKSESLAVKPSSKNSTPIKSQPPPIKEPTPVKSQQQTIQQAFQIAKVNPHAMTTYDEVHMNVGLVVAKAFGSKHFQSLGESVNEYCVNISRYGECERFLENIRETFEIDEDTYFSEDDQSFN